MSMYEFVGSHIPTHIGYGRIGSLHKADSVITTNAPQFECVIIDDQVKLIKGKKDTNAEEDLIR
ncbi:hypothetical protein [Alkalihalobacillus sp. TS-13]|uniref:hypothetical protein n=1 Tax=Alkalihalobacillus sp. TS-13 TaxID=2842455 RepID=UPI001C878E45|nr:hypothetical protein [Alkalihalobacillus sp. TS-13]